MFLSAIAQVVIGIFGTLALFLTIKGNKFGSWIGIFTSPFWIWMALSNKLYGVLVVSVLYLAVWIYGVIK
jgi:hypothetical protein